jgi:hypothetical protein
MVQLVEALHNKPKVAVLIPDHVTTVIFNYLILLAALHPRNIFWEVKAVNA